MVEATATVFADGNGGGEIGDWGEGPNETAKSIGASDYIIHFMFHSMPTFFMKLSILTIRSEDTVSAQSHVQYLGKNLCNF
jgi:hypothetical protein